MYNLLRGKAQGTLSTPFIFFHTFETSQFTTAQNTESTSKIINLFRSRHAGDVTLSAVNLPSNVTAIFSKQVLTLEDTSFSLRLLVDATAQIATTNFKIVATSPGVASIEYNFSISIISGPVFDGPAELPGIKLNVFKLWANDIPDWDSIPAEKRFAVSSNSEAALQSAIYSAAGATGGHRAVVIPNDFNSRCKITLPVNADPAYDVIIVWEKVINKTFNLTRGVRISKIRPTNFPLIETKTIGSGSEAAIFTTTQNANTKNYKIYGVELRTAAAAASTSYCAAIIDHGDAVSGRPANSADAPGNLLVSHCIVGGRKFDSSGNWRTLNLGRFTYDNSQGYGMLDCWDVEHGTTGSSGSDRGIWATVWGQGPVWINNNATDFGGGIVAICGGADTPTNWPDFTDFEFSRNWIERKQLYNKYNTAERELDASGGWCTWTQKNQFETKAGFRINCTRNVFYGAWMDGQNAVIALKATNENGGGKANACSDVAFTENLVISGQAGLAISSAEGYQGGNIHSLSRVTIRDNVFICGQGQLGYIYSGGVRSDAIFITTNAGVATVLSPTSDFLFLRNYFEIGGDTGGSTWGWHLQMTSAANRINGIKLLGNVWALSSSHMQESNTTAQGLNGILDGAHVVAGSYKEATGNVIYTASGNAPAADSNYSSLNTYRASKAAMGISNGAEIGQRIVAQDSILLTAGPSGGRAGPDMDAIHSMRLANLSGVQT